MNLFVLEYHQVGEKQSSVGANERCEYNSAIRLIYQSIRSSTLAVRVVLTGDSMISGVVLVTLLSPSRSNTDVFLPVLAVVTAGATVLAESFGGITFLFSSSNSSTSSTHSTSAFFVTSGLVVFNFLGGEGLATAWVCVTETEKNK